MASGTNGESETKPRAVCAFHCANRAPALARHVETGARLRSMGRARKWLRRSRRTRLRVIEGVGVEREDALKVLSGHHSQSRCRARGRRASTVPGGTRAATNGSFESPPAVRLVSREGPEPVRVFGCLPGAGARGCTEAGVRKASREETAGGVRTGGGVRLWRFSAGV